MAKPRGLPEAAQILSLADGQRRLTLRAVPNARTDAIVLPAEGEDGFLQVRITRNAEDGKANAALLALLAKALDMPKSELEIVQGATSRIKVVRLPD